MNQWYCGVEGQQYGPYTWEQMRAMADEGRLIADSFVRREVDPQWLTASQVPGLLKKKAKPAGSSAMTQVVAKKPKATDTPVRRASDSTAAPAGGNRIATKMVSKPVAASAPSASATAVPVGGPVAPAGGKARAK